MQSLPYAVAPSLGWPSLAPVLLPGWSKTSQSLEAPEDDGGWSSAEEPINSSDAEEDGSVGPKKLVTLLPMGGWGTMVPGEGTWEVPLV